MYMRSQNEISFGGQILPHFLKKNIKKIISTTSGNILVYDHKQELERHYDEAKPFCKHRIVFDGPHSVSKKKNTLKMPNAERCIGKLVSMVRVSLHSSFWGEAVMTSTHISNRMPTSANEDNAHAHISNRMPTSANEDNALHPDNLYLSLVGSLVEFVAAVEACKAALWTSRLRSPSLYRNRSRKEYSLGVKFGVDPYYVSRFWLVSAGAT